MNIINNNILRDNIDLFREVCSDKLYVGLMLEYYFKCIKDLTWFNSDLQEEYFKQNRCFYDWDNWQDNYEFDVYHLVENFEELKYVTSLICMPYEINFDMFCTLVKKKTDIIELKKIYGDFCITEFNKEIIDYAYEGYIKISVTRAFNYFLDNEILTMNLLKKITCIGFSLTKVKVSKLIIYDDPIINVYIHGMKYSLIHLKTYGNFIIVDGILQLDKILW